MPYDNVSVWPEAVARLIERMKDDIIIYAGMDGNRCVCPDIKSVSVNGDAIQINLDNGLEEISKVRQGTWTEEMNWHSTGLLSGMIQAMCSEDESGHAYTRDVVIGALVHALIVTVESGEDA